MSKTSTSNIIVKTRENLEDLSKFFREIIEVCQAEGSLVGCAMIDEFEERLKTLNIENHLNKFIKASKDPKTKKMDSWYRIAKRDEIHFRNNIVMMLDEKYRDNFEPFLDLLDLKDSEENIIIDDDYKDVIWAYAETFVKFSLYLIHNKKEPVIENIDGEMVNTYKHEDIYPDISQKELKRLSDAFKIELKW